MPGGQPDRFRHGLLPVGLGQSRLAAVFDESHPGQVFSLWVCRSARAGSQVASLTTCDSEGGRNGLNAAVLVEEPAHLPFEPFLAGAGLQRAGKDIDQPPPANDVYSSISEHRELPWSVVELDGKLVAKAQGLSGGGERRRCRANLEDAVAVRQFDPSPLLKILERRRGCGDFDPAGVGGGDEENVRIGLLADDVEKVARRKPDSKCARLESSRGLVQLALGCLAYHAPSTSAWLFGRKLDELELHALWGEAGRPSYRVRRGARGAQEEAAARVGEGHKVQLGSFSGGDGAH